MEINLKGQIVVLDEAHNIEDCARESASYTLNQTELLSAREDLESMMKHGIRPTHHNPLLAFCCSLTKYVAADWFKAQHYCFLFVLPYSAAIWFYFYIYITRLTVLRATFRELQFSFLCLEMLQYL